MSVDTIRRVIPKIGVKSKKFFWDFPLELSKTVTSLEIIITSELPKYFTVDSIIAGNNDIKIRVRDESNGWEKIISAILRYHHDDEKYGNVHIEIAANEKSKRNKSHFLGQFSVTDRKSIEKNVMKALILGIRAIY
jgi:hypothetical protein